MKNLSLSFALVALVGCHANIFGPGRQADVNDDGSALPRGTGCLAGVVEDGITGARIDIAAEGKSDNFFVLVSDSQRYASPLLGGSAAADYPHLVGEYTLCDIPVESEFPIYVSVPGYQAFESVVLVPASDASQGAEAEQDVLSQVPTLQANIRLFPVAPAGKDYQVVVSFNGAPLAGAAVELVPTGGHVTVAVNPLDDFLDPVPRGYKTLKGTTNDAGVASFPAADLALGAVYRYLVLPVDASVQTTGTGTVSVGYVTTPSNPYVLYVDLAQVSSELVIVSKSTDSNSHNETGSISFVFNRPIELFPDSLDGVNATLSNAVAAEIAADVPGNKESEQVAVTISGQVLTLTPKFKTNPDKTKEPAIEIAYSGVRVRPTVGQKLLQNLLVAGNVVLYGGQNSSLPTNVTAADGNNQSGDPGDTLTDPLVAKVVDQDGQPMAGITVEFAVSQGGGTLSAASAVTNAQGEAEVDWTIGTTGTQEVEASVDGIATPATFTATFTIASLTIDSGNTQTGATTAPLTTPLTVVARDASNALIVGGTVTFTVQNATNGGKVRAVGSTGAGSTTLAAVTDANGKAQVEWVMSAVAGNYTTQVTAGTATAVNFTATSVAATLAITGGNTQTGNNGTELAQQLVVKVTDGTNNLQNIKIRFATADTNGALGATTGTAADDTLDVLTDAAGEAKVFWKLGTTVGAQTTTATILGSTAPAAVTFTATAN